VLECRAKNRPKEVAMAGEGEVDERAVEDQEGREGKARSKKPRGGRIKSREVEMEQRKLRGEEIGAEGKYC